MSTDYETYRQATYSCDYTRVITTCYGTFQYVLPDGQTSADASVTADAGADAITSDSPDANASDASPEESAQDASTADAETLADAGVSTQEAKCLAAYYDVAFISKVVSDLLAVNATCVATDAKKVPYGSSYYFTSPVRCALSASPSSERSAAFSTEMIKRS